MRKMEILASFSSTLSRDCVPQMQTDVVKPHIAAATEPLLAAISMPNGNFSHFYPVLDECRMLLPIHKHDS